MFSGIIHHSGEIQSIEKGVFRVAHDFKKPITIGDSIAHDGACMSITEVWEDWYEFFVMQESFDKTQLGQKQTTDTINIEQSISYGDSLDGHILSGHIDTTGTISDVTMNTDGSRDITIQFDEKFSRYTVPKWWIAINGVSLTIVDEWPKWLQVSIIPLTAEMTNIWNLQKNSIVNLEFDEKVKTMQTLLEKMLADTTKHNNSSISK